MRYKKSIQEFYEALLIIGGQHLATFIAQNLGGHGISTICYVRYMKCEDESIKCVSVSACKRNQPNSKTATSCKITQTTSSCKIT